MIQSGPQLVTSCWSMKLPKDYAPIGISRGTPRGRSAYRRYTALQPGPWFASVGAEEFTKLYSEEILGVLHPEQVVDELLQMSGSRQPALLCWEKLDDSRWCHRALVSIWLWETLGLRVPELGHSAEGFGWTHPKCHQQCRPSSVL